MDLIYILEQKKNDNCKRYCYGQADTDYDEKNPA